MFRWPIFVLALMLGGCAAKPPALQADEALIVFIRPGMVRQTGSAALGAGSYQPAYGPAFTVTLHDVTSNEPTLVAILSVGEKFGYPVKAGPHRFMLMARNQNDFLDAKVDAGKSYYVIVEQGAVRSVERHSLRPIRREELEGRELKELDASAGFVASSAGWKKWEAANAAVIKRRMERGVARAPAALAAEDGR
jgi:hypothetical protein